MACGRDAPRPCGWLISTQRERSADLPNYLEVIQRMTGCFCGWLSDPYDGWLGCVRSCVCVCVCVMEGTLSCQDVCQVVLHARCSVSGSELAWMTGPPDYPTKQMMPGTQVDGQLGQYSNWLMAWVIVKTGWVRRMSLHAAFELYGVQKRKSSNQNNMFFFRHKYV